MAALLSGCNASLLEPAGQDRRGREAPDHHRHAADADRGDPGDLHDAVLRLEVPRVEHLGHVHAQLVVLAPDRGRGAGPSPSPSSWCWACITWKTTHELDPYRPLESERQADRDRGRLARLEVAVHLSRQHIATVNEIQFPAGTPVNFKITSDTVMNVFFIPQLGSQIYAMAGMQTQVQPDRRPAGRLRRHVDQLQRRGLPRHEVHGHRHVAGRFRRLGRQGQGLAATSWAWTTTPTWPSRRRRTRSKYFSNVEPVLFTAVLDKYMDKSSGLKLADKICLPTKVVAAASKERAE